MAKDPRDRFSSPSDFVCAFELAAQNGLPQHLRAHARRVLEKHPWDCETPAIVRPAS